MTKRTPELNRENGYKGQIAKLKNENEKLKAEILALASQDSVNESESAARIRNLKRFMERLIAPLNKDKIKHTNPELASFIDQTLAAIDFAAEVTQ